ncbi:4Fe-4S dicluster domain-containing protein [Roseovarius sp. A21]|uniref:4Fe-4S dicluster domain-containing protein n=1 Tax=Roseovarius bejariae TaxID=2576383 RepID=A0A844CVE8_9RHOB|nr:4Fe-4S binding protein [Roseovarius bejariae]MRU14650.1 4Fe-4S dicluster domain-containing protein [Roseovarius bejariae]
MAKRLILCNCSGTQKLDSEAIEQAVGLPCSQVHSALCTGQIDRAIEEIGQGDSIICCQQEQRIFEEIAVESEGKTPAFTDLRDRAGWSDDPRPKLPKMAALLAEATLNAPPEKTVDVISEGLCLIIGGSDVALDAAEKLAPILGVTVLLTDDIPPPESRDFDAIRGDLKRAEGALGQFRLRIDRLQQVDPTGRGPLTWTEARDGGQTECDVILDLTGETPLFPAPQKREGYLRADPGSLPAVADAVLQASQLIGTFEKPLYVATEPLLCAHSRAEKTGCTKCLDLCPTGAISPDGDHVTIDPMICAGCGACSARCPSGAITYDAPAPDMIFRRIHTLASAYRKAGGEAPRLLVHDTGFGREMISLAARHGRGLPADVIPLEVPALSGFGHAEILAALASGFADVTLLLAPTTERDALDQEVPLAQAMSEDSKVVVLDVAEPDALCDALYGAKDAPQPCEAPILPMGSRRQVARLSAKALHQDDTTALPLPENAPYGAVLVNADACTLCLSCVSLCPSGALVDNPDMPQLRFQEDACLQCGLCANVCPEDAISYEPRMNLADEALTQVVLHEEEPFACIECGSLFGVKSTVENITEKLAGKHSMFANDNAARMIQMCDNCRVKAQFHSQDNPFAGGERPQTRTTDDYFSKRRDH